jgi:hypothetical protein
MAILDRPMFQRPLTKDELRQYGIPAFANGGVVQKFAPGGDVNRPDYSENFTKPINVKEKFDIATTEMLDPKVKEEAIRQGRFFSPAANLEEQISLLEKTIAYKEANGIDASADKAELNNLKSQLVQEQQEVTAIKEEATPVPTELTDALKTGDTEKVRETLLTQEGPGQDIEIKTKIEEQENDRDPLGPEKDKLSELEAMVRERSDIYKKILGDPKEGLKQQGLLQLAQFGLNLASARGGTFAEKIAKSAKDPLQTFAALGREALKDERAIDMLAIKGAEDEVARTQKVGNFGQLVQDYVNEGFSREKALEKAEEVFAQKSGKTITELKNEAYKEYLRFYEAELGAGDEARNKANKAIEEDFGTPMFKPDEPEVKRAT